MRIELLPTDFNDIKESVKRRLKSDNSFFKNYDFSEGSTGDYVCDILAYITAYENYNTSVSVNENFLYSAQIPKNIYAHAKQLGYNPKRKTSATADVVFRIAGLTFSDGTPVAAAAYTTWLSTYLPDTSAEIDIPIYTVITTDDGAKKFMLMEPVKFVYHDGYWVTMKSVVDSDGRTIVQYDSDLTPNMYRIKQGYWTSVVYTGDGTDWQKLQVNDLNVEDNVSSLQVVTLNPANNMITESWSELATLEAFDSFVSGEFFTESVDSLAEKLIYVLRQNDKGLELTFGDDVLGKAPEENELILIKYLVTEGADGNGYTDVAISSSVEYQMNDGYTKITTMPGSSFSIEMSDDYPDGTVGGSAAEDNEATRALAPLNFGAQGTLVRSKDYQAWLLRQNYVPLSNCVVRDGEELYPKALGTIVAVCSKAFSYKSFKYAFLSGSEKTILRDLLTRVAVTGMGFDVRDPDFMRIGLDVQLYFDPLVYDRTEVLSVANAITGSYFDDITGFNTEFKPSNMIALFDNTTQIDSVTMKVNLSYMKRLDEEAMRAPVYLNVANELEKGSFADDSTLWFVNENAADLVTYPNGRKFFERKARGILIDDAGTTANRVYRYSVYDVADDGLDTGKLWLVENTYNDAQTDPTQPAQLTLVDSRECEIGDIDYAAGNVTIDLSRYEWAEEKFLFHEDAEFQSLTTLIDLPTLFLNPVYGAPADQFYYMSLSFKTTEQNVSSAADVVLVRGNVNLRCVEK